MHPNKTGSFPAGIILGLSATLPVRAPVPVGLGTPPRRRAGMRGTIVRRAAPRQLYLSRQCSGSYLSTMLLPSPRLYPLSENTWLVQFYTGLDVRANAALQHLAGWLRRHPLPGQQEIITAYDSLLMRFQELNTNRPDSERLEKHITKGMQIINDLPEPAEAPVVEIPVCYDPVLGNDLQSAAIQTELSPGQIIEFHSREVYQVYQVGFLPGFPYMGTLHPRLHLPRKKDPVLVKAGAVAIAGSQTGIYPVASPGGWHILGYTPLSLFAPERLPPALLEPGQKVRFVPVSVSHFNAFCKV